jgi:hypothetical protein
MLGRAAYQDPLRAGAARLAAVWRAWPRDPRERVVEAVLPYLAREAERGTPLKAMTRHLLGSSRRARPGAPAGVASVSARAAPTGAVLDRLATLGQIGCDPMPGAVDRYRQESPRSPAKLSVATRFPSLPPDSFLIHSFPQVAT